MIEKQAFEIVIAQERQILDIQVRQDRARLRELLHPDFEEFGASWRIWDLESVIEALTSEKDPQEILGSDFEGVILAPNLILLKFRTEAGGRVCLRSSIWMQGEDGNWKLRFHQGTVVSQN